MGILKGIIDRFRALGKTAILKMSSSRNAENRKNTNNWRKMHGLPMRRKQKVRKRDGKRKRADCHRQNAAIS